MDFICFFSAREEKERSSTSFDLRRIRKRVGSSPSSSSSSSLSSSLVLPCL